MRLHKLHVKPSTCPGCSKVLDGADGEEGTEPAEGCVTVCIYCCTVAIFTAELELRLPEPGELEAMPPELHGKLDFYRGAIMQAQRESRIMERLIFKQEDLSQRETEMIRRGRAAIVGVLCSSGPPPRKMRPAEKTRCTECRKPIWVPQAAPRGLRFCVDCTVQVLDNETRGDT